MAATRQKYDVRVQGGVGIVEYREVLSYELLDLKASVYHKLVFSDGTVLYLNDFGIKSVQVTAAGKARTF